MGRWVQWNSSLFDGPSGNIDPNYARGEPMRVTHSLLGFAVGLLSVTALNAQTTAT